MAFNLAPTDTPEIFTVDLDTLNADFGSNADGIAVLTLTAPDEFSRSLRVQIDANGLEDLTDIPGAIHVAHIHGQFFSNLLPGVTPLDQRDGPFFDGVGGIAVDSDVPTLAEDDADGDGFLNFIEGLPSYGPVVLNLTEPQIADLEDAGYPPEGTPPLDYFLELASEGVIDPTEVFPSGSEFELDTTYDFDLTDPDQLRQFNNLNPLAEREIVLHGLTVPTEISDAIDEAAMGAAPPGVDLGNGEAFRVTAPVAAGVIEPLPEDTVDFFTVDLDTLNADFGSEAEGTALLTLLAPEPSLRLLRVQIDADGLEDLSDIPGGVHVGHIHGQFLSNLGLPPLEQRDGPFFEDLGGIAVDSTVPTLAEDDADGDGFLNFIEGLPSYGPVVLNLTEPQIADLEGADYPPEGTPPLNYFLELADQGVLNPAELFPSGTEFELDTVYSFDLTDPDQLRQFNNLSPLDKREIVLHGLTVPTEISDAIDEAAMGAAPPGVDLGNGESFRVTAPVAAGVIEAFDEAAPLDELIDLTGFDEDVTANVTISREAGFDNVLQFYATNAQGRVAGLLPGEAGYEDAVRQNLLSMPELFVENRATLETDITLEGGTYYAPVLLVDGDPQDLITIDDATMGISRILRQENVFRFEDLMDFDFNDFTFALNSVETTMAVV